MALIFLTEDEVEDIDKLFEFINKFKSEDVKSEIESFIRGVEFGFTLNRHTA